MTANAVHPAEVQRTKTVSLTVDGIPVTVREGTTVLEAARRAGIYIPTLCHDDDLEPYGACRLCVVEIENMRGLPTSCTTAATDGMVVRTETQAVERSRRMTVELIMANHPNDCLACAQNQDCELQRVARYVGVDEAQVEQLRRRTRVLPLDDSNPAYVRDMNKCILCGRCVRACHEVTGIDAIDIAFRGNDAVISTFGDKPILLSRCETCGECISRCPTGALVYRNNRQPTREVKTTCTYCAVGCQMFLGVRGNEIVRVRPDKEGPSNEGHLCVKGRFGIAGMVHSDERVKTPLIKRNGVFEEASWDEALDLVASRFKTYSPEEIGVVSSARATNEDNYVMQKFGRAVLGTNNVDHCARL